MNEKVKPKIITAAEFEKNSIKKMATRPTRPSAYGASSLTPQEVKEYFDKNPEMLKDKINEVIEYLPYLATDVNVDVGGTILTLAALAASIAAEKGIRMQDLLKVDYGAEVKPLGEAVDLIVESLSDNATEIGSLSQSLSAAERKITANESDIITSAKRISANEAKIKEFSGILDYSPEETQGLEYILSDDGTYYICDGGDATGDLVIPSTYKGLPVTEIAERAFYGDRRGYKNVTSVIIPSSIKRIGECAFESQWRLRKVVFRGTPDVISGGAFETQSLADMYGETAVPLEIYAPFAENVVDGAPWGGDNVTVYYEFLTTLTLADRVTVIEKKLGGIDTDILNKISKIEDDLGDIDAALDSIIARQTSVIGGVD